MASIKYLLHSGKNSKLKYFAKNVVRVYLVPFAFCRARLSGLLRQFASRADKEYIMQRVNYYCKLQSGAVLDNVSPKVGDFKLKGHRSAYFFDTIEYLRYFPAQLKWDYRFGDVTYIPVAPAIVKSRPIAGDNAHSVVLNLDKARHFTFLNDHIPFAEKENRAIFRGDVLDKPHRIAFCEQYIGTDFCDAGEVGGDRGRMYKAEWIRPKITLYDHLKYKFIICLEGNDVASNLKWVMSSNSLAVMPKPKYETWFMEGRLIPNYHYMEIKPDYSDLEERMNYYIAHPDEAQAIIDHAHEWCRQFFNPHREKLISLLVLEKYFKMTGQM